MRVTVNMLRRPGWLRLSWPGRAALRAGVLRVVPFLVALALLGAGYALHASSVSSASDYQQMSYKTLSYSDIVWLYIRDHLNAHPRPYIDYRLEYPALTGGLIYLLGFATELHLYYALSYAVLAVFALATIAAVGRLTGARIWYLAAAPGLVLYTGLNWDFAALALLALALLAYQGRRDVWGTLALVLAVWLKFFPIVFLGAILIERLRTRNYRALLTIGGVFAVGSAVINGPLALRDYANWVYFFTSNDERRPEPSLWTLLPSLPVEQVNHASLEIVVVVGVIGALLALGSHTPVTLPLGATLLVTWLFSNKVYSPQYSLWVYFAIALLGVAAPLWRAFCLLDLAYYFASFQILFTSSFPGSDDIGQVVGWQARYLLQPLVAVRLIILFLVLGVGLWRLARAIRRSDWRVVWRKVPLRGRLRQRGA